MSQPEAAIRRHARELARRIEAIPRGRRLLVALAGAPASGKSALAEATVAELRRVGAAAEVVPMDGFHLDNRILSARGLLHRKGAPETFDAAGFVALMRRIREGGEVVFPVFDRARDIAIAGAGVIEAACEIVLVEGNYLLFDAPPWGELADLWDLSVWLEVPEAELLRRCTQRWLDHGHAPEAALARARDNDIANARRISGARLPADLVLTTPADEGAEE